VWRNKRCCKIGDIFVRDYAVFLFQIVFFSPMGRNQKFDSGYKLLVKIGNYKKLTLFPRKTGIDELKLCF